MKKSFTEEELREAVRRLIVKNNNLKFGNIRNKDWYTFSGITISYTFGRIPCYCKEK